MDEEYAAEGGGEYQVGEMLICKTYFKVMKKIAFNVNY